MESAKQTKSVMKKNNVRLHVSILVLMESAKQTYATAWQAEEENLFQSLF